MIKPLLVLIGVGLLMFGIDTISSIMAVSGVILVVGVLAVHFARKE